MKDDAVDESAGGFQGTGVECVVERGAQGRNVVAIEGAEVRRQDLGCVGGAVDPGLQTGAMGFELIELPL